MSSIPNEAKLNLALKALHNDKTLSVRAAAKIYNVADRTLRRRLSGRLSRLDTMPNSRKMFDLEGSCIVRYILELEAQGYPPRVSHVEDMANRLLDQRGASRVRNNWTSNFIRRHQVFQTRFTRRYDHHRALCEDPNPIREWFNLVQNTVAKYAIDQADMFNFDETGLVMGVILPGMVVTQADRRGNLRWRSPGIENG